MYLLLITVLVILTGIYIIFNKELFTNSNKNSQQNNNKKRNNLVTMYTITNDEREYVKFLIQNIVENVNKRYSKKLSLGNIEQVEKQSVKSGTRYNVIIFINNDTQFDTKKYVFDFVLTDKATIVVRDIKLGASQNFVLERVPYSERGSTLFKPKSKKHPKYPPVETSLEYSKVDKQVKKDSKKAPVDPLLRNKTILPCEAKYLEEINYRPFPCRKIDVVWDKQACSPIECANRDTCGEFHGRVKGKVFPNFNPTLFTGDSESNHWLFDLGADSASRPIGVTGARGN